MRYVFADQLKQGMILATDLKLHEENGKMAALLTQGQRLTEIYITKIKLFHIKGALIEDNSTNEESDTKKYVEKAMNDMVDIFEDFKKKKYVLDETNFGKISIVANDLVKQMLTKKDYTFNLRDLEVYDDYTYHHSLKVAILCVTTSIKLGFGRKLLNEIAMCALLHDIGKMLVPLAIINKQGPLTAEEYDVMKRHPQSAVEHLREKNQVSEIVIEGILDHHEKVDGTGYPGGKKEKEISLFGRILAVCDVYDALISKRPYRDRWFPNDVIEYMMGCAEAHFDFDVLSAFLKSVSPYPIGAIVALSDGKKAIVTRNNASCILRPVIRIVNQQGDLEREINLLTDLRYSNVTIVGLL